VSVNGEALQ